MPIAPYSDTPTANNPEPQPRKPLRWWHTATSATAGFALGIGVTVGAAYGIAALAEPDTLNPTIEHVSEVEEHLADTDWACSYWYEFDNEYATCYYPDEVGGASKVSITKDPELYSALAFDSDRTLNATATGDNWVYVCDDISPTQCGEIADLLGGDLIERGHWSN